MRHVSLLSFLFAATAGAQHVVAYDPPPGAGQLVETQVFSRLVPAPMPPDPGYLLAWPLPPLGGAAVAPAGDATYDGLANRIWYSNGQILASQASPNFPVAAPALAPFPIAPGVLAAIGGPATGIAIQPVANVMFLISAAGIVVGVTPAPGTPVVVPPFALPFLMGPATGLDYDSVTNSLFVCDAAGMVYNVAIGGAPLAPPIGPMGMPGVAGDVAIDKTTQLNPAGFRPIYVVAGPAMRDVTTPLAPMLASGAVFPTGLAFVGRPANQPGGSAACGGSSPLYGANAPMTTNQAAFGLRVKGLPAFTPVVFAVDWTFNPAGLLINGSGNLLHLVPGSPSLVAFVGVASAAGDADLPINLVGVPAGTGPLYTQALWPCTADPAGFALTETQSFHVTGN